MYGLEGILGNLVTSVATPAVGGIFGDMAGTAISEGIKDEAQRQLLKEITQTTVGALSGAAVGAGLGALTGGKSGALSGALTGGVGGGVGGYNAPEISQMFGMNQAPPQGVGAPQGTQLQPQASPMPFTSNAQMMQDPTLAAIAPKQSAVQLNAVRSNMPPAAPQSPIQDIQAPTQMAQAPAPPTQPSGAKGYMDFLKKNYEPLAGGFFLGSAYGANQDTQEQSAQSQQRRALQNLLTNQSATRFGRSIWGYADGGPVEVGLADPQISVHFPAWAQEQIQREGGLAALQPGIKQGMATGGYINLNPEPPQGYYPMSQIASAHPYPAATPQRQEVVFEEGNFARGGLIDGPGDGQSDDIPANISGREEVRVADGEYVIPKEIAAKYGPDKLKRMMTEVRKAAHAKKGAQIIQDAGKKAFIRSLSGVKV